MAIKQTTGINISDASVEWTTLRASQDGPEIAQSNAADLSDCGALPSLFHEHQKDIVVSGLPASALLMHVLDLPSTDSDEIAGMIELQIDKISPYPLPQLVISYEVLAQGETHTRVLVVGVKRSIVDKLGARFETAGLILNSLDSELLCRWQQLLMTDKIEAEGAIATLIIEKGEAGLIIADNGEPILFRALPLSETCTPAELIEELDYSITTLEQEFHLQGLSLIETWTDHSLPELMQAVTAQKNFTTTCSDLAELPPLSEAMAYRYHRRTTHHMELVPPEWTEATTNKALMRKLYKFGGIVLSAWLGVILLLTIVFQIHSHQTNKLRAIATTLDGPAQAVQEDGRKVNALLSYTDQDHSALEALREVSSLLPAGIDLSAFNYKKGSALTLRGESTSSDAIYAFNKQASALKFFTEIKDFRVTSTNRKGVQINQFSLTAVLEGVE